MKFAAFFLLNVALALPNNVFEDKKRLDSLLSNVRDQVKDSALAEYDLLEKTIIKSYGLGKYSAKMVIDKLGNLLAVLNSVNSAVRPSVIKDFVKNYNYEPDFNPVPFSGGLYQSQVIEPSPAKGYVTKPEDIAAPFIAPTADCTCKKGGYVAKTFDVTAASTITPTATPIVYVLPEQVKAVTDSSCATTEGKSEVQPTVIIDPVLETPAYNVYGLYQKYPEDVAAITPTGTQDISFDFTPLVIDEVKSQVIDTDNDMLASGQNDLSGSVRSTISAALISILYLFI
jgi:hypothetical protein